MNVTDDERQVLITAIYLPQTRNRVANYIRLGYSAKRIAELMGVREGDVAALKQIGGD